MGLPVKHEQTNLQSNQVTHYDSTCRIQVKKYSKATEIDTKFDNATISHLQCVYTNF